MWRPAPQATRGRPGPGVARRTRHPDADPQGPGHSRLPRVEARWWWPWREMWHLGRSRAAEGGSEEEERPPLTPSSHAPSFCRLERNRPHYSVFVGRAPNPSYFWRHLESEALDHPTSSRFRTPPMSLTLEFAGFHWFRALTRASLFVGIRRSRASPARPEAVR